MRKLTSLSIVIPVYNSENVVAELFARISSIVHDLGITIEVIAVDDGSMDNSWNELIKAKSNCDFTVRLIRLSKNYGQHHALICGIKNSSHEAVITLDDDLEFYPEDIPMLIETYESTLGELIYGIPKNKKSSLVRKTQVKLYRKLANLTHNSGIGSSFRLLSRQLADAISTHQHPYVFIDELCLWYTDRMEFTAVQHAPSKRGRSNYSTVSLLKLTTNLIVISSTYPLRVVTTLGSFLMIINFIIGGYYIIRKLFFALEVPGYTSLIVSVLFSTGLILFALGIIAQYMSKLLLVSFGKPSYHIAEEK